VRPVPRMTKIDRIDDRGDIREHLTRDGRHTICGIEIGMWQPACGNRLCKRCTATQFAEAILYWSTRAMHGGHGGE